MKIQAFSSSSLTESIVSFIQFLRSHAFNTGIEESKVALIAADHNLFKDELNFKYALKTICCTSPDEINVFEGLFHLYWNTNPTDTLEKFRKGGIAIAGNKVNSSTVFLGFGQSSASKHESKQIAGANEAERLRRTDFSKVAQMDAKQLEELADKLFRQMSVRLRRRLKTSLRDGFMDYSKTIRHSLGFGGEPIYLYHRERKQKKPRLIVFLDVSGSMDKYSFYLLRFICALKMQFRQLEAFAFSTKLRRISGALRSNQLEIILQTLTEQADHWSGGTRIGECLRDFNERYATLLLNGSPVILILSDGLETGELSQLDHQMRKLNSRTKKLIWLNPLKGSAGYEPSAGGMKIALPSIHEFRSAHNIQSMIELENILFNV